MSLVSKIDEDLKSAIKAKEQIAVDVLRGLKTRVQNEQKAKGEDVSEEDVVKLVSSEMKRRKEAEESFTAGGRPEMAEKENKESKILEQYLPEQMSEDELGILIDKTIEENNFTAKDFGKAMGLMKAKVGAKVQSAVLVKSLKEKLK